MVVGVTGHRDVPADAVPQLQARFAAVLDDLQQTYPHTQLLVLSALAAGADMLAAQTALERGHAVYAVLPMPQEQYEEDFTPPQRDAFRNILARCAQTIVTYHGDDRVQGYAAAGTTIAYYSHLLVAFWDGLEGQGTGGTASVVAMRKTGIPDVVKGQLIPYLPDIGPILHIVTPRTNKPKPESAFLTIESYPQRFDGDLRSKDDYEAALRNLDRFNRDTQCADVTSLDDLRARTDKTANELQKKYLRSLTSMYIAAIVAGSAQILIIGPQAVAWRIGILVIAFLIFWKARREDYENRYQDYRAIAEGLRVQNAWCCAGLSDRMVDAAYSRMQYSELQWIRMAIRTAYVVTRSYEPCAAPSTPLNGDCATWITDQRAYYKKAAPREKKRLQMLADASKIFMATCIAVTAIAIIAGLRSQPHPPALLLGFGWLPYSAWLAHHQEILKLLQTAPIALAAMVALMLRFYSQQRGYNENARRYAHMYNVFDYAQKRLDKLGNTTTNGDAATILHELGREALIEHSDWLVLHRERPFQFVSS